MDIYNEGARFMRIGITGAQSVGKTTLLNALRSEKLFSENKFVICDEVTRRVKSYGLPINEDGTDITQHLIMNEHIVNVFMHDRMLTDRTVLDGLVYTTYLYKHTKVNVQTVAYATEVFNRVWKQYDHVFYIQPEFDVADDGVRSVDVNFRNEIADMFDAIIINKKLTLHQVKGSVRNRVNLIMDLLEGR